MLVSILPFGSKDRAIKVSKATPAETKLVIGLKTGDKKAITQLYAQYAAALFGIIKRIVKHEEIAEDALQDTFVKIWKSIVQYDETKGRLFTWMANLAKHTAIDQLRSKQTMNAQRTDDLAEQHMDILCHTHFNPELIGVKQLLQRLKSDQQAILELVYFEGFTHVEAAQMLGMPLGTIKTKLRLSILALRVYCKEVETLPFPSSA